MINGHVTIRIGTDQTLSWEGPRETELYTYWKATLGDLEAQLAVSSTRRRSPQISFRFIHRPTRHKIVSAQHQPRMTVARAKSVCEDVLTQLQPGPTCPSGCHIPYGYLPLHDIRVGTNLTVHWTGWTDQRDVTSIGVIVCHRTLLFPGGMVPIDPETRYSLPEIGVQT